MLEIKLRCYTGNTGVLSLRGDLLNSFECDKGAIDHAAIIRVPSSVSEILVAAVGGRYRWFSPPTLRLISWKIDHNHAKFTYINEFHKFWWVFECRNNMCEIWPKWEKYQAGQPINLASQAHLWPECSWVQIQANPMWFYTKCTNQDRKAWAMISWVNLQ